MAARSLVEEHGAVRPLYLVLQGKSPTESVGRRSEGLPTEMRRLCWDEVACSAYSLSGRMLAVGLEDGCVLIASKEIGWSPVAFARMTPGIPKDVEWASDHELSIGDDASCAWNFGLRANRVESETTVTNNSDETTAKGHAEEAITLAEEANEEGDPDSWLIAMRAFFRACAHTWEDPKLSEQLAQCLLEADMYRAACYHASKAAFLLPHWADAHATTGRALMNAGDLPRAARHLREAASLDDAYAAEASEADGLLRGVVGTASEVEMRTRAGTLTLKPSTDGIGPGGVIWECGALLAALLSTDHGLAERIRRKRILELGAATGIAGLSAAACGANVTLTDTHEVCEKQLVPTIERAREELGLAPHEVSACPLDWTEDMALEWHCHYDMVLGADLAYTCSMAREVANVVSNVAAANNQLQVLLAHKRRHNDVDALMKEGIEHRARMTLQEVTVPDEALRMARDACGSQCERIVIWFGESTT